jgi:FkbM family methyltransferase
VITETRSYEPHVTRVLREVLKAGDVFVDIGANLGYFSLLAASLVGPEGRVIAFEPNPSNCLLIRSSIARNGFETIELHANAVAERQESFILEVDGSNGRILPSPSEAASPDKAASVAFPHSYLVQAVVLDELLAGEERINVVKVDIEGAEPRALRGMTRLVQRHRPVLITEFFPSMLASTSGAEAVGYLDALREFDYALCVIDAEGGRSVPQSNDEIFDALAQSGSDHLDLLALPEGRSG